MQQQTYRKVFNLDKKKRFKNLYISLVIEQGQAMSEELNELFEYLLLNEFNDNPEKMSDFIQTIIDENTPRAPTEIELLQQENAELKQRQEMAEEVLLMLSDVMLG